MKKKTIDCRSQEGITVGLIDSLISISRVLSPILVKMDKDELSQAVHDALKDLVEDKDVLTVLRMVHSSYILTEQTAELIEKIINSEKDKIRIKS